ncbi:hypothetical protein J6590_060643, partial [Homalodisca vitripennis]
VGGYSQGLKATVTVPIHKKEVRSDADNYRPIALVAIFSKIIKPVMKTRIAKFFDQSHLVTPANYGFRNNLTSVKEGENVILGKPSLRPVELRRRKWHPT